MNHSDVLFSNLTTAQIEDLRALETKFNTNGEKTILIAYENPK
ncbi:hypothetical protein [Desulfosporosinus youngiae]|uniref:Uncharacterized protein n=1 Tax=Desulfosporosinus youngiae DSM 17734 TaxID=768710 RepID=H5Y0U8_9FIRM|nr:hypothetical protein [Desulfosporosinus youngiae]EHQ92354.1 hypothetical protein DesyoDRAFT_5435 [Desulfosporosinus youngiae DSM 17734]